MFKRIFEIIFGIGWKDLPPAADPPIPNYIAACARPYGDSKRHPHYFGRGAARGLNCHHCGHQIMMGE